MNTSIDPYLEAQYNNRAAVADFADYINSWAERSDGYRRAHGDAVLDIAYGDHERARLDIFPVTTANAPVHVFIHGGYWKALNKDYFSFVAKTLNEAGEVAVILNYPLCPAVSIADITRQVRQAIRWVHHNIDQYGGDPARCQVSGHSAGGHLVASLLTDSWTDLERHCPPLQRLTALSGLFDLKNLVPTSVNDVLGITASNAESFSPLMQPMPCRDDSLPLNLRVGGLESDEYKKQSQSLKDAWSDRLSISYELYPDVHHFSIVDHFLNHDYQPL